MDQLNALEQQDDFAIIRRAWPLSVNGFFLFFFENLPQVLRSNIS